MKEDEYPVRPGEQVCPFYLKTGRCGFGEMCRFNHPKGILKKLSLQKCKFFLGGFCKHGSECKFKHPKERDGTEAMRQDQKRQRTESNYGPSPERRAKTIDKQRREAQDNLQEEKLMPNLEEQRKRDIERQRKEARMKIEQMKQTACFDDWSQVEEGVKELGCVITKIKGQWLLALREH